MSLNQHANNEKAFVWSTVCDFSDGEARPETFCIRFGSVENAHKFKTAFDEAKATAASISSLYNNLKNMALDDESSSGSESAAEEDDTGPSNEEAADKQADANDVVTGQKTAGQGPDGKQNDKPEADQVPDQITE